MTDVEIDDAITTCTRLQAVIAGHRFLFIAEKADRNYDDDLDTDEDTQACWNSVAAEIALASGFSHGRGSGDMEVGMALGIKVPRVAELLLAGTISEAIARRIVFRTALIQNPELLAKIDEAIAERATFWGTLSSAKLDVAIDLQICEHDPAAIRHTRVRMRERGVELVETREGVTEILARVTGPNAGLFWQRINAMAKGVCKHDPRTLDQRRSDAYGALGAGSLFLSCECDTPDCPAAVEDGRAASVVVHIYAEAATLDAEPDPYVNGEGPLPDEPVSPPMNATRVHPDRTREPAGNKRQSPGTTEPEVADSESEFRAEYRPASQDAEPDDEGDEQDSAEAPEDAPVAADRTDDAPAEPDSPAPPAAFRRPPAGILIGIGAIPAPLIAALIARGAPVRFVKPPGVDPESRYSPSTALEQWCKARDLTCRWGNCDRPAQFADWDHTTPWPAGKTHASGGKMFCKLHHFGKTFWPGWSDEQLADGTIIFTTPTGQTYTSKPGSRLFFPTINTTSAPIDPPPPEPTPPDKIDKIPKHRRRNHARERAHRIKAERALNDALAAQRLEPPLF